MTITLQKMPHCNILSFLFCTSKNVKSSKMKILEKCIMPKHHALTNTGNHLTNSLDIRYLKVKLWGIHSMLLRDFPSWHFLILLRSDSGKDCWIISMTPAGHKLESFANDSIIFGNRTFWSLRMPNVARMYSSFAVSSSWNTLFGV